MHLNRVLRLPVHPGWKAKLIEPPYWSDNPPLPYWLATFLDVGERQLIAKVHWSWSRRRNEYTRYHAVRPVLIYGEF
jgi:hypothetical protein